MQQPEFSDLYRRHGPTVFRRARQLLGNEALAHEVVQDLFISLFENPSQFAGRSNMTTFLYSATTHACLNQLRNQKNRDRLTQENSEALEFTQPIDPLAPEERSLLESTLRRMPEELAQATVYHFLDGLTHDEISRLLDCSRRHVGNLLQRAQQFVAGLEEVSPC